MDLEGGLSEASEGEVQLGKLHRVQCLLTIIILRVCMVCMHGCLACATVSFRLLAPLLGARGHARMHALFVHIIAFKLHIRAWSLWVAGLALNRFWLKLW